MCIHRIYWKNRCRKIAIAQISKDLFFIYFLQFFFLFIAIIAVFLMCLLHFAVRSIFFQNRGGGYDKYTKIFPLAFSQDIESHLIGLRQIEQILHNNSCLNVS